MTAFEEHWLYHITEIKNLPAIAAGGLLSDIALGPAPHAVIGYNHIKRRRMTEYKVPCSPGTPFVGNFVPFYYCPRSVMLYTINAGRTGLAPGCQKDIVHLVTTVGDAIRHGANWAISDGNAGAAHTSFYSEPAAMALLDWAAIRSTSWSGKQHQKAAEFLVRDSVPWTAIRGIGCYDNDAHDRVVAALAAAAHRPTVKVIRNWYY